METQVLIIGAGATGAGILRDLSLRGVSAILVDQKDAAFGATGGNHGLLHSGARYAVKDAHSAEECALENAILKETFPQCVDPCGGYFIAVEGDDEKYIADFPDACKKAGIDAQKLDLEEAKESEPAIAKNIIAAYSVPDAAVDPFMLTLENIASALEQDANAQYLRYHKVIGFIRDSKRIIAAKILNTKTGQVVEILADQFINATGAWAAEVAKMAGCNMEMTLSKGTLIITQSRVARRVINRLRAPGDGDILVPGGSVSILGTTSITVESPDDHYPTIEEVDANLREGIPMVPLLETTPYIRAYAGIRPLLKSGDASDGRGASRGFALVNHEDARLSNFVTVTGGKLTTYRLMAEKTCDYICERLGVTKECQTKILPARPSVMAAWTDPSLKHKYSWWQQHTPHDYLLCECEVVPRSGVDKVLKNWNDNTQGKAQMQSVASRSRVGKGPCQGTFCGARVTAHLYDCANVNGNEGLEGLRNFLSSRWRGQRYVMWGKQFSQAELKEALYFGLLGLEEDV